MCYACMNMSMWRKYFHVQVVHVFHIGLLRDPILEILQSVSTVPLTILYDQLCQGGKNLSNLYLYIYTCVLLWSILTCSCAHAPWGQAVWCGEAVEHADILRSQELHKLGVVEHFPLAVQDGCCLVRDVNNLPRDERHCYSEYILKAKTKRY